MRDGDDFAKQFGGAGGDDPDFFSVTFTGWDDINLGGSSIGSVEFFLADYRFADNNLDYIVDQWMEVNLNSLSSARSIEISFDSSDVGMFGTNTPLYVAVDNVTYSAASVPEPEASWFFQVAFWCSCEEGER